MSNRFLAPLLLVAALAASVATIGWWAVPVVAVGWGLAGRGSVWWAPATAIVIYMVLFGITLSRGPVPSLAQLLGQLAHVPAVVFVLATFVLPGLLAWSAAEMGAGVRRLVMARH